MRTSSISILILVRCLLFGTASSFLVAPSVGRSQTGVSHQPDRILREIPSIMARRNQVGELLSAPKSIPQRRVKSSRYGSKLDQNQGLSKISLATKVTSMTFQALVGLLVLSSCWFANPTMAIAETDPKEILSCLLEKCPRPLTSCVLNPKCLANVICLNTCSDNIECQIKCGDLFENPVVGEFNKCVVSDMSCVKQKPDDGSYPLPKETVKKFDTSFFNGRLYITAGRAYHVQASLLMSLKSRYSRNFFH